MSLPTGLKYEHSSVTIDALETVKGVASNIEKKIRNLEKKKNKLDDYEAKRTKGAELNKDQTDALKRYETVTSNLDLLHEFENLVKQLSLDIERSAKRAERKARSEKEKRDSENYRFIVKLQSILFELGDDAVRQAFVEGTHGAIALSPCELDSLDELYKVLFPQRGEDPVFNKAIEVVGEHFVSLIEGRDQPIVGTTYKALLNLYQRLAACDFFLSETLPVLNVVSQEVDLVNVASNDAVNNDDICGDDSNIEIVAEHPVVQEAKDVFQHNYCHELEDGIQKNDNIIVHPKPITVEQLVEPIQGIYSFLQDSEVDSHITSSSNTTTINSWSIKPIEDSTPISKSQDWAPEVEAVNESCKSTGSLNGSSKTASWNNRTAATPPCSDELNKSWTNNGLSSGPLTNTVAEGGSDDIFSNATQSAFLNPGDEQNGWSSGQTRRSRGAPNRGGNSFRGRTNYGDNERTGSERSSFNSEKVGYRGNTDRGGFGNFQHRGRGNINNDRVRGGSRGRSNNGRGGNWQGSRGAGNNFNRLPPRQEGTVIGD